MIRSERFAYSSKTSNSTSRQNPSHLQTIPRLTLPLLRNRHTLSPLCRPLSHPTSDCQLQLTAPDVVPHTAKIGVSVEDLSTLASLDVAAERRIEHLAMKVGESLFNFMQSFCGVDGSKLVVPIDILDRWFKKFQGVG